jgi:hypothetical protein
MADMPPKGLYQKKTLFGKLILHRNKADSFTLQSLGVYFLFVSKFETDKHCIFTDIAYTGCFMMNSKYFSRWQYGLFRVNKFI